MTRTNCFSDITPGGCVQLLLLQCYLLWLSRYVWRKRCLGTRGPVGGGTYTWPAVTQPPRVCHTISTTGLITELEARLRVSHSCLRASNRSPAETGKVLCQTGTAFNPSKSRLGGVVVIVRATRSKGHGFRPGQGDRFLMKIKVRSIPSFGWEVKPDISCRTILRHTVWEPLG
jgi:hypothetical protein